MTTRRSPYVSQASRRDAARRQVRTRGKRVQRPRSRPAARPRSRYQRSAALGGLSGMFGAVFAATGSVFAAVGVLTAASASVGVAYLEYRRDLLVVKRTGRPIDEPTAAARRGDLSDRPEPKPVDLDAPPTPRPRAAPQRPARRPAAPKQHGPEGHVCEAKTPSRCPYYRAAQRGRTSTTTTRKRTRK